MQTLDIGEVATLDSTWYDLAGDAIEPTAITLTLHPPSGADVVAAKTDMTGSESVSGSGTDDVWTYQHTVTAEGVWLYDIEGTVNGDTVSLPSGVFLVGVEASGGPCEPWATWADVEACGSADRFADLDSAQREHILDTASSVLFDLSGRRYTGVCTSTRSLCRGCRDCGDDWCSCTYRDRIDLGSPVWGAWDVTVDGTVLDPSAYTVLDRRWLVRLDHQSWPSFSDVTDPSAFTVTWAHGRRVPPGGRRAAAKFAEQLALACIGSSCDLPSGITSVNREGISMVVLNPMNMLKDGRTGVYLVDLWITADARGRRLPPGMFHPNAHGTIRART